MRTLLFFDQVQSGHGGKEDVDVALDVEKGGIGSALMFKKHFVERDLNLIATMYSGNQYYFENEEKVKKQIVGLINKLDVKLVICGPTYDYRNFAEMATNLADYINKNTDCVAIVCAAEKNNEDLITQYKEDNVIVKMPKKGGVGLSQALENMVKVGRAALDGNITDEMQDLIY